MEGHYKAGKKTGEWKYYNKDGNLESTENYSDDELNGRKCKYTEMIIRYAGEINYRHDKRNGQAINQDPDGSLLYTIQYNEGKISGDTATWIRMVNQFPKFKAIRESSNLESFFQKRTAFPRLRVY